MKKIYILILISFFSSSLIPKEELKNTDLSVSIIVNKNNPVASLTVGEVKLYWLRKVKKRWPEINKNIKPADRKSTCPEQELFYKKALNMTGTDVESYFTQKQYENAEKPQDKFSNDVAILEFVGEEIGAIGYVNSSSLAGDTKNNIKVVCIVK